jgi:hypothetical protein
MQRAIRRRPVVVPGTFPPGTLAALEQCDIRKQLLAGWVSTVPEPNTMLMARVNSQHDAQGQHQQELEHHGDADADVADFEATLYSCATAAPWLG